MRPVPVQWSYSDGVKAYEEGKHRRYTLLFTVNGAAFAVLKLVIEHANPPCPIPSNAWQFAILGKLTLAHVAIGMFIFSAVMTVDLFCFGLRMSEQLQRVFGGVGKAVLLIIGVLLCSGWLLVIA